MHNYFSCSKAETRWCVLSWGFPPKCHIQTESYVLYVLDYPKFDLRENVRETESLEHFEQECPYTWRIPLLATQIELHQSWK